MLQEHDRALVDGVMDALLVEDVTAYAESAERHPGLRVSPGPEEDG